MDGILALPLGSGLSRQRLIVVCALHAKTGNGANAPGCSGFSPPVDHVSIPHRYLIPPVRYMHLDLPTLLLIRLCLDGFLVALYLSFARRHNAVGGPAWWAASVAASAVASLGVGTALSETATLSVMTVGGSLTAMYASHACVWLGLRSYLGLPVRQSLKWAIWGGVAMFAGQALLLELWDIPPARRALFIFAALVLVVLNLMLVRRRGDRHMSGEFQALRWLLVFEGVGLAVLLIRLLSSLGSDTATLLSVGASYVVLFITLDGLLRAVVLSAMVSYRLQQNSERNLQKLADGKAKLRALIDNIHAGVIVFNPDQSIETINAAARRFVGWPSVPSTGAAQPHRLLDWSLLNAEGQPLARHDMPFEQVLATGQPLTDVVIGVRPRAGAGVRWALCNAFADNDALGGLRHVVITFVDITSLQLAQSEQKALQVQLAQSQKMEALGTLAGGVAHDFNNILAAILGNADLARQDILPDAPARQSLHEISTAARRGRELVRQILAFSRQQPMERQRISMRAILAESCSLLKAAMPSQVHLDAHCGPGDLSILADATQLGQVLLNLGTNARHAMGGQPGRLELRVDRFRVNDLALPSGLPTSWPGVIRVRVRDNGCGMDEATRLRMFEPFFTTRSQGTGTGLGLPVVLGIVQSHEGTIEVQSELGAGSTFDLFFPAAAVDTGSDDIDSDWSRHDAGPTIATNITATSTPIAAKSSSSVQNASMSPEPDSPNRHILYLDDDDTLVFLVRRLLQRRGYTVTTFTDQQEAIEAVRAQPDAFDLLMTDFNMPGMSGLDVAKAVLAINPSLPVAIASGYITDELQAESVAAGVREVVFKTDAVEDFCAVVARLVSGPEQAA